MTEERRLTAIMFVDICGFSRIMGQNETQALAIVDMATSVIESATDEYDGRIIKKLGDGILAEFTSAVNAVQASLEVQRAVNRHNDRAPEEDQFSLRIGIHVGDVVVSDGDIFGDGVNVASRIEPLAEPGGICISRDVLDMVHSKIELETVKLGPQDLKNIARKIDIYGVLVDAMSGSKTIRIHRRRKVKRLLKRILMGVGIFFGVILLIGILKSIGEGGQQDRAREAFKKTEAAARRAADSGRPEEALDILRGFPEEFRETEFQQQIDNATRMLDREMTKQELARRTDAFISAVIDDNRSKAFSLMDPAVLRQVDASSMWMRLRLAAGIFKIAAGDKDNIRLKHVDLEEDNSKGMVFLQFRKKTLGGGFGEWESPPPWEWRNIDGEWLLYMKPPDKPVQEPNRRPMPGPGRRRISR